MRFLVTEIGIVLLLGVTFFSGGGVALILVECTVLYWLCDIRKRNERDGEQY